MVMTSWPIHRQLGIQLLSREQEIGFGGQHYVNKHPTPHFSDIHIAAQLHDSLSDARCCHLVSGVHRFRQQQPPP